MMLAVFEDDVYARLYPLTYLRATFELRSGMMSAAERVREAVGATGVAYYARELLAPVLRTRLDGPVNDPAALEGELLLVNGRVLDRGVRDLGPGEVVRDDGHVLAARLAADDLREERSSLESLLAALSTRPRSGRKLRSAAYPWDLVNFNGEMIAEDFFARGRRGVEGEFHASSVVQGPEENFFLAESARVEPFVCIDCRGGPVYIDSGAVVSPHTRIEGPGYIGRDTMLVGGKVREGCSIGPVCRVGGEIEETILHGYSNKYHDGFLGHAYVCEWVNLGALTTNSDIKNDYSTVKIPVEGRPVDTGSVKVGCFIGDHTKTSIGTSFNTGSHIGVMTLLVGSGGVLPKFVPSFAWFVAGCIAKGFGLDAMLKTARAAMGRRKKDLSPEEEELIKKTCELTAGERKAAIRKDRKKLLRS